MDAQDFRSLLEKFKDLTPEKEERVKKRVEDLTAKMQHHTNQAKQNADEFTKRKEGKGLLARIKQIVVGNKGPRSRALQHVAKGKKYAKHVKNAQDALSRSSAGRSASLIHKRNQVKQQLQNLGVNPDAGPDSNNIRRFKREEVDLYDIILSHLLDEGYAETPEAAEKIMVNMSEEWREDIVEVSERGQELAWKTGQAADRALSRTTDPKKRAALHGLSHAAGSRSLGGEYPDTPDMMVGGKSVRKVHDVRRGGTGEGDPDSDRGERGGTNNRSARRRTRR